MNFDISIAAYKVFGLLSCFESSGRELLEYEVLFRKGVDKVQDFKVRKKKTFTWCNCGRQIFGTQIQSLRGLAAVTLLGLAVTQTLIWKPASG